VFWSVGYRKLLNDRTADAFKHLQTHSAHAHSTNSSLQITDIQESVLAALYAWRDRKARENDESCDYIMSNSELVRIGLVCPKNQMELEVTTRSIQFVHL
jgi:ribonuclease D